MNFYGKYENLIVSHFSGSDSVFNIDFGQHKYQFEIRGDGGERRVQSFGQIIRDFSALDMLEESQVRVLLVQLREFVLGNKVPLVVFGPFRRPKISNLFLKYGDRITGYTWSDQNFDIEALISKKKFLSCDWRKLQRDRKRIEKAGFRIYSDFFLPSEVRDIHLRRWGENRSKGFFRFLEDACRMQIAISHCLYSDKGILVAAHVDFLLPDATLYYFSAREIDSPSGAGNALRMASFSLHSRRLKNQEFFRGSGVYSFGRGAEIYKFSYADEFRPYSRVIGFYTGDSAEKYD